MEEPLTDELLAELLSAPGPAAFVDAHCEEERTLAEYLQILLGAKGLERSQVIRDAGLNETYGYQIFMGTRKPKRNKLLQIAFAMKLSLLETNHMMQAAGVNELYCKTRRDAIIIFCLDRGYTLFRANEELFRFGEETIC